MFELNKEIKLSHLCSDEQYIITRNIIFSGEVSETSVEILKEKIDLLNFIDKKSPISLEIDTYGGDMYGMFALYDKINLSQAPIDTIVNGKAMSAGFIIALAGKRRYITKNATMMFHQVRLFGGVEGQTLSESRIEQVEAEKMQIMAFNIINRKTKIPKRIIDKIKQEDVYFNAKECLKYKIVDKIL